MGGEAVRVRKRPRVVEAVRVERPGVVRTAHGWVPVVRGDDVLTDPERGDSWPINAELFDLTYEIVEDENRA